MAKAENPYYNPKDAKQYIDGLKGICRYYKVNLQRYSDAKYRATIDEWTKHKEQNT